MNGISFRHGSLFSGIGGFDYASSLMGWENVFHCELNPFCRQVLKYHFPNSVSYEDITKTDFSVYRGRIDIITGGFPCQPYSLAGKRLGKDDERHLWPEMLRVIREVSPKWVVGENVFGIVNWSGGLVFEEVQADLEREGYEVQSYILPAAGVDAPHKRDRVWFVGYSNSTRFQAQGSELKTAGIEQHGKLVADVFIEDSESWVFADAGGKGREEWQQDRGLSDSPKDRTGMEFWGERFSDNGVASNANCFGNSSCREGKEVEGIRSGNDGEPKNGEQQAEWDNGFLGLQFNASNADSKRQQKRNNAGESKQQGWFNGKFPSPENWQNFPTQSPVCVGDDGISSRLDTSAISFSKWRNESIKAAGNAVVPQVVLQIFKAIQAYEDSI